MYSRLFRFPMLIVVLTAITLCSACGSPEDDRINQGIEGIGGRSISISSIETTIENAMEKASVAGLSCAIINGSEIVYAKAFGYRDSDAGLAADEETVFSAASFSKTVFAYLVLLLCKDGILELDKPLHEYFDRPLPDDPYYSDFAHDERYKLITARMVLSHSTGLPNVRLFSRDGRLEIMFEPGTRYSYSGEGYKLLQMVVEHVTAKGLEELSREKIFVPLSMARTSFVWQEEYEGNHALPHNRWSKPHFISKSDKAGAAGSMLTTASDFARFIVAVLNADGIRGESVREMLKPQIALTSRRMFGPDAWNDTDENRGINLSWGLGWGLFETEHGHAFFRTGHGFGNQNYTVTYLEPGIGVVLLSNSDNFESVAAEIVEAAIGDTSSPYDWLGYVQFDPSQPVPPPPERTIIEVAEGVLQSYAGAFEFGPDNQAFFKLDNGGLFYSPDNRQWIETFAESTTDFFIKNYVFTFSFVRDDSGHVDELILHVFGIELRARRIE